MDRRHWPLYGLRIRTPRLELRLPDLELLDDLSTVAADGVHAPDTMPFTVPWTDGPPAERGRGVYQHVLGTVANWSVRNWVLSLAVLHEGKVVGRQDLGAADFAVTGEVSTGSWLGLAHQGQGIGTEMRAAVLHLAFAGLGARTATSSAMTDNPRSLGVSRRLGYLPDGLEVAALRGAPVTLQRLRIDRDRWAEHRTVDVRIEGLDACRKDFGG
ncbi:MULTISPECIES: GNAT family N-acetyltransferase [unclassified Streptomyces]|jgi:RimJ/RimL family protein N-acetyltransferase|uniref:GNAT family N-acetyltransferase n=1 Tax=unclassified Streptomyces TaxID=2593676 RepID=UPI002DDB47BE|nr:MULTISPECIES: GNAT family protein [unclassified Streptomyces]WSA76929.1 GNAT family N-acetyltransferase [Streptomyces sp. NBC_01799]WSF86618.1 GNAT family N-acetyltransferase [Streptomyces sp. NBC_01744]WSA68324.1 GNAT family N-acetyltransferase [Streptomyces sp. NBC_01800]WSC45243.1 GNAT family N-acetyltransferase [Streptomyces sp. NBC_01762]WSC55771.1 GNAT family N-acetyltransferase [Streptomyces sp. NBC_01761]